MSQVVVMGEKVYIGGGLSEAGEVFQYDPSQDEWSFLPPCQVIGFAMAQFMGYLITVGGVAANITGILRVIPTGLLQRALVKGLVTSKVYHFKEQSQKWEEFLKPMPTARYQPSVATTQSAIVASGGSYCVRDGKDVPCATVEVYTDLPWK